MVFWYIFLVVNLIAFVANLSAGSALWAGIDAVLVVWCLNKIIKVKED